MFQKLKEYTTELSFRSEGKIKTFFNKGCGRGCRRVREGCISGGKLNPDRRRAVRREKDGER